MSSSAFQNDPETEHFWANMRNSAAEQIHQGMAWPSCVLPFALASID